MKYRFVRDNLIEGLSLHARNEMWGDNAFAQGIWSVLGSWGNHDGVIVKHNGYWAVAEAVKPVSRITPLEDYEAMMSRGYRVHLYRLKTASNQELEAIAEYYKEELIGIPYPGIWTMKRLILYRFFNSLPFKIMPRPAWCTALEWEAIHKIIPNGLDGPIINMNGDRKKKQNPTPRTFENRLAQGLFDCWTDKCIEVTA